MNANYTNYYELKRKKKFHRVTRCKA